MPRPACAVDAGRDASYHTGMRKPSANRLLVALLLGFVGCGPATIPIGPGADGKTTLIYGRGADSTTLDPADAEDGESVKAIVNLFDNLVTYADDSTDLAPGLATAWTMSEDRLRWTFTLRAGVTFHDGAPFDAEAVVFTFERLIDAEHPDLHDAKVPYAADFKVIEKVEATGPLEVAFTLERPSGVFLRNLAMFTAGIVSPDAVRKHGEQFKVRPVGSGPFRFEEWRPSEKLSLVAFADHWRGPPKVDRVIFKPILEDAARLRQLRSGEIDMADELGIPIREQIRRDDSLRLQTLPGLNIGYLALNNSRPPFDSRKARLAIAHAIDKSEILESVYENAGVIADTLVPKTLWGHDDSIASYPHDPDLARKLLAEAGIEPGSAIRFWAMTNPRPYMPAPSRVAAVLQQQLRAVGVEMRIQSPPWSQYLDQVGNGEHEACLLGWQTDNADPDNFLYALLDKDNAIPPHALNVSFYKSDELHDLLIAAQRESDQAKRTELYHQAQKIIHRDCPMIPLMSLELAVGMRERVVDYHLHPTGNVYLRSVRVQREP